jgi:thiol-disulfide isomerase/thioredoxin
MMANIMTDEVQEFTAPIDSVGHFSLRMPIVNTTSFLLDGGRKNVSVVAEPNETYFLTIDELQDKVLFMGRNARLQNEVRAHHIRMNGYGSDQLEAIGDFTAILDSIRTQTKAELRELDAVCYEHPTLSGRYRTYYRNSILANGMSNLMRAKFLAPNYELPEAYMKAVEKDYWQKLAEPYTLEAYTFTYFFNDYSEQLQQKARSKIDYTLKWIIDQAEKDGIVSLSAREREAVAQYDAAFPAYNEKLKSAPDSLREAINAEFEQNDFVAVVNEIISREGYHDYANTKFTQRDSAYLLPEMNAQGWSQTTQDIFLSRYFCHLLRGDCKPLDKSLLAFAEAHIHAPAALSAVRALSDKYEQLSHFMLDNEDCFKSNDIVKDMSDGEAIFQKIIEPYRGRVILVDVWGTWCGPCKAQLSHCQEEYERLKDYDVVYLYLANNSSDEAWKKVIKMYDVTGDNVVHYNLESAEQNAIEQYFQVSSFPSYYLIDKDGRLLPYKVDARDLDALEELIKRIQ